MNREVTPFEQRVYEAVSQVPKGRVTTYALLARKLDCGSPQAVGQALKRNPFAPEVPCHRVIKADLSIGGYMGETDGEQWQRKLELLRDEGVEFDRQGHLTDKDKVFGF